MFSHYGELVNKRRKPSVQPPESVELLRQIEDAHLSMFEEVDRLIDICTLLLDGHQNVMIENDEGKKFNITCLGQNSTTRILVTLGEDIVDYSVSPSQLNISRERCIRGKKHQTGQVSSSYHCAYDLSLSGISTQIGSLSDLQEELLVTAGYIEYGPDQLTDISQIGYIARTNAGS